MIRHYEVCRALEEVAAEEHQKQSLALKESMEIAEAEIQLKKAVVEEVEAEAEVEDQLRSLA